MEILTWDEFATKDDHRDQLEAGAGSDFVNRAVAGWLGGVLGGTLGAPLYLFVTATMLTVYPMIKSNVLKRNPISFNCTKSFN